jgi:hypothetical protein
MDQTIFYDLGARLTHPLTQMVLTSMSNHLDGHDREVVVD